MTKKLVNAGLKYKREAAQALLDGRVFITALDNSVFFHEKTGFMCSNGIKEWEMSGSFNQFLEWQEEIEVHWYEDIPEGGVLCWVSDRSPELKDHATKIYNWVDGYTSPFIASEFRWKYATPVKPEECYSHEG